jgi:hypothetical protein
MRDDDETKGEGMRLVEATSRTELGSGGRDLEREDVIDWDQSSGDETG